MTLSNVTHPEKGEGEGEELVTAALCTRSTTLVSRMVVAAVKDTVSSRHSFAAAAAAAAPPLPLALQGASSVALAAADPAATDAG